MYKVILAFILLIVLQFIAVSYDMQSQALAMDPSPKPEQLFKKPICQELTLSAYTPDPCENWGDASETAFGTKPVIGTIAVSQDLYKKGWKKGRKVRVVGHGVYKINDLMHKRHKKKIDIFMLSKKKARKFGVQKAKVILLTDSGEEN